MTKKEYKSPNHDRYATLRTTFAINTDNLRQRQQDALLVAVCDRLDEVSRFIASKDFDKARACLENSPAGDDMGCSNEYIDFSDIATAAGLPDSRDGYDIGAMLETLKRLST